MATGGLEPRFQASHDFLQEWLMRWNGYPRHLRRGIRGHANGIHVDTVEHRRAAGRLVAQRYRSRLDVARLVAQVDPRLALALLQRRRP